MRILLQRVTQAQVTVEQEITGAIQSGLLLLVGFHAQDRTEDLLWTIKKVLHLRIFNDREDKMNLSITEVGGELLVVSQFTLFADTAKGNRPSFIHAAPPEQAKLLYDTFLELLQQSTSLRVAQGVFGADMKVELLNDGPVTIFIDTSTKGKII